MNSDTGEVGRFNSEEEAKAAGFDVPLTEPEFQAVLSAPKALNVRRARTLLFKPVARIKDGNKRKFNWANKYIKMIESFNRFVVQKHNHWGENARRARQIERGTLTVSNGLVKD